jgi:small GTP-binding protein
VMMRFADNRFSSSMISTAGVDYKSKIIHVDGKVCKVSLWDTAGQERFHQITKTYYKGAHGIILMYDVCDKDSFNDICYWMSNIELHSSKNITKILVANKVDKTDRVVSTEEGMEVARRYNLLFIETSCKDGTNIENTMTHVVSDIFTKQQQFPPTAGSTALHPISIITPTITRSKRVCTIL